MFHPFNKGKYYGSVTQKCRLQHKVPLQMTRATFNNTNLGLILITSLNTLKKSVLALCKINCIQTC